MERLEIGNVMTATERIKRGRYVNLVLDDDGNLHLEAAPLCAGEIEDLRAEGELENHIVFDLLEDHLCNGWHWVDPALAGFLVGDEMLILTDDWEMNEDGDGYTELGTVYYHDRYALDLVTDELLAGNRVSLKRHDSN